MRLKTLHDLFARLKDLAWQPHSIEEVREAARGCDLMLLRGCHSVETFTVRPGMSVARAASMIRGRKGNSRVRLYVTLRANNRM